MWNLVGEALKLVGGLAALVAAVVYVVRRWIDHALEKKLAAHKDELAREVERLRFELQREMLKAQFGTGRIYEVAPKLIVKVKKAHGALASVMGLSFAPDWKEYSTADLDRAFDDRKLFPVPLLAKQRGRLLDNWESADVRARREAKDELHRLFFQQQVGRSRHLALSAHNHAVLTSVLLPRDLAAIAMGVTQELVRASINAEAVLVRNVGDILKATEHLEALGPKIQALEDQVRAALSPAAGVTSR